VVRNQVVVLVDVGDQLAQADAGRVVGVPVGVIEHRAQFLDPAQASIEHVLGGPLRQRREPDAESLHAFSVDPDRIGVQFVQQGIELGDGCAAQRQVCWRWHVLACLGERQGVVSRGGGGKTHDTPRSFRPSVGESGASAGAARDLFTI
jgi:hypothetical protein